MIGKCKYCRKKKELEVCNECGLNGVVNTHKEVFEETVFDRLEPRLSQLDYIDAKLDLIIKVLSDSSIIKKKIAMGLLKKKLGGSTD